MEETNIKTEAIETTETIDAKSFDVINEADLKTYQEMLKVGAMYGHKKTRTNPKFKKYIFATRNNIEIIDLVKTLEAVDSTVNFLNDQIKGKKTILLVSTQPAAWEAIDNLAKKLNLPCVKNRWIGGLITNFKVVSLRLEYFKKIQTDMESGALDKYTKKERVMINKNIHRMKKMFGGLETLTSLPDILFVVDASIKGHMTAIREAKRKKIPIVAIIDSDDNPDLIDYPIPANDHSKMSIEWVVNRIIDNLGNND